MTEIGTVIDGKYEILKEIGRGGMSVVYLAMDKHLNKQWAVKEIRKKGSGKNDEIVVNSLLAEANMMKKLDHPALPRIVDIIDNGVTIYVVMDYIEGESLDKILNEYGAQPEELVVNWAKQLCDALSYLHSQRPPIIYRDMKPANVMLKPEGNIKIIDFGIAREYKEQNLADTTVLGTKGYAPPEQYSGQTDPRSDIFALGMTMHHLLTGVDPRNGEPYASVRQWNPELSEGIEIIIDRCVEPAAENRYQSCADLLYDLEHPELITKGFKKKQRRKLISFIVAIGMSAIMAIAGLVLNITATNVNNQDYDANIASSDPSKYFAAVEIYPERVDAYNKLIEYYKNNGASNDQITKVGNTIESKADLLDITNPEVADMYYDMGYMSTNQNLMQHMRELIDRIKSADVAYYRYDNPTMTDREYDLLVDELKELETTTGLILSGSPTQTVSGEILKELTPVRHTKPMLSADKTKSVDEMLRFANGRPVVLSWKLDGLTLVLRYEGGEFKQAITRGREGIIGEDVTHTVRTFMNVPMCIPCADKFEVRGEGVISWAHFEKLNLSLSEPYSHPRNLAAGSVRMLDARESGKRYLEFFAFDLISDSIEEHSKAAQLQFLAENGFDVVPYVYTDTHEVDELRELIADFKPAEYGYPVDGVIMEYDNLVYGRSLGATGHHENRLMALKWEDELYETECTGLDVAVTRTGMVSLTATFKPVEIDGTMVSRAYVHNFTIRIWL